MQRIKFILFQQEDPHLFRWGGCHNSKAYGLTDLDRESIMINLKEYKDKLKEVK